MGGVDAVDGMMEAMLLLDRLERQAIDLGARDERMERLERFIADQNNRLQALLSEKQNLESQLSDALHAIGESARHEFRANDLREVAVAQNRELSKTITQLEARLSRCTCSSAVSVEMPGEQQ